MLASPGVDLRREDDPSVSHVSSLGFFNADGVPFQKFPKKKTQRKHSSSRQQRLLLLLLLFF